MMRSKPSLLVAPLLLLTLLLVPASPDGDPGDEDLRYQSDRVMERVLEFEQAMRRDNALLWTGRAIQALVVVFGAICAYSPRLKRSSRMTWTVAFMGLSISALTGLKPLALQDDEKTIKWRLEFRRHCVADVRDRLAEFRDMQGKASPEQRKEMLLALRKALGDCDNRILPREPAEPQSAAARPDAIGSLLPVLFAQSKGAPPAWTQRAPTDDKSLYYVGSAADPSLATARSGAEAAAIKAAASDLAARSDDPGAADLFVRYVSRYGSIEDRWFSFESAPRAYRFFALYRLDRDFAEPRSMSSVVLKGMTWSEPVALSYLAGHGVFVLDSSKGLLLIPEQGETVRRVATLGGRVSDLTTGVVDGRPAVFVAAHVPTADGTDASVVTQWSPSGDRLNHWECPGTDGVFSGIAVDQERATVFVASSNRPSIFRIDVRKPTAWFCSVPLSIPGADTLGAMALHEARNELLVADEQQGLVYGLTLDGRTRRTVARRLRRPAAIAVKRDRLYVARAAGTISTISLDDAKGGLVDLPFAGLRTPKGLTIGKGDSIWVADSEARTVIEFAEDGRRLRTIGGAR